MNLEEFKKNLDGKKSLTEILKKGDYCRENGIAFQIADYIKSMNQLSDFFDPIDSLHERVKAKNKDDNFNGDDMNELLPLHFELANRVAREVIKKEFYELMKKIITKDVLKQYNDFFCFHELLRATIAFKNYRDELGKGGKS